MVGAGCFLKSRGMSHSWDCCDKKVCNYLGFYVVGSTDDPR